MCSTCFSLVQFQGILPTDTNVSINGGQYSQQATVQHLVDTNPQFWFEAGIAGYQTLTTVAKEGVCDVSITVTRGGTTTTTAGWFVGGRPIRPVAH